MFQYVKWLGLYFPNHLTSCLSGTNQLTQYSSVQTVSNIKYVGSGALIMVVMCILLLFDSLIPYSTVGELLSQYGWYLLVVTVLVYVLIQYLSRKRSSNSGNTSPPTQQGQHQYVAVCSKKAAKLHVWILYVHWDTSGNRWDECECRCGLSLKDWISFRSLLITWWKSAIWSDQLKYMDFSMIFSFIMTHLPETVRIVPVYTVY